MIHVYYVDHTIIKSVTWDQKCHRSLIDTVGRENVETVFKLRADYEELDYINNQFKGIRKAKHCVETFWRGDDAKFIVENL